MTEPRQSNSPNRTICTVYLCPLEQKMVSHSNFLPAAKIISRNKRLVCPLPLCHPVTCRDSSSHFHPRLKVRETSLERERERAVKTYCSFCSSCKDLITSNIPVLGGLTSAKSPPGGKLFYKNKLALCKFEYMP